MLLFRVCEGWVGQCGGETWAEWNVSAMHAAATDQLPLLLCHTDPHTPNQTTLSPNPLPHVQKHASRREGAAQLHSRMSLLSSPSVALASEEEGLQQDFHAYLATYVQDRRRYAHHPDLEVRYGPEVRACENVPPRRGLCWLGGLVGWNGMNEG